MKEPIKQSKEITIGFTKFFRHTLIDIVHSRKSTFGDVKRIDFGVYQILPNIYIVHTLGFGEIGICDSNFNNAVRLV